MKIHTAENRGATSLEWLNSKHTFSFGRYYDEDHMQYRSLRVINDDIIEVGGGFDTHGHKDMEIISLVLLGVLEHKDSLGNTAQLKPGDVQVMTAGSGIRHSEYNPSNSSPCHLIQVWIIPEKECLPPRYEDKTFMNMENRNKLVRVAGKNNNSTDGALKINQEADVYLGFFDKGKTVSYQKKSGGAGIFVQILCGGFKVNEQYLKQGDSFSEEIAGDFTFEAMEADSKIVLFELI